MFSKSCYDWSFQYLQHVETILETLLRLKGYSGKIDIRVSTKQEDFSECADLVINEKVTVMVRTRDTKYINSGDFVLRATTGKDGLCEFDKVLNGKGNYLFYSYAENYGNGILTDWWMGDLNVFRNVWNESLELGYPLYCKTMFDRRGEGKFNILKTDEYPNFIIKRKGDEQWRI